MLDERVLSSGEAVFTGVLARKLVRDLQLVSGGASCKSVMYTVRKLLRWNVYSLKMV